MNKKNIYKQFGIEYKGGKIYAPFFGWISPVLVNGNSKLGAGVWTFSSLPGNFIHRVNIDGEVIEIGGTCPCNCSGCYAQTGLYNMPSVKKALAIRTVLARLYPDFLERAIIAQIIADEIKLLRIHASGDFFSVEYVEMWKRIAIRFPGVAMWTYTKYAPAEKAFDDIANCNVVKSIIPGCGVNFGKCAYIIALYQELKSRGLPVYICRCGIDKNQHCVNCKGCSAYKYVLFIEHSTAYKAESDPLFPVLREIIENQPAA